MAARPSHRSRRIGAGRTFALAFPLVLAGAMALAGTASAPAAQQTGTTAPAAQPLTQRVEELAKQEAPLADLSQDDLQTLIATLDDPQRRQRLLRELRALEDLRAAQQAETAVVSEPDVRPLRRLIQGVKSAGSATFEALQAKLRGDYSQAVGWQQVQATFADSQRRSAVAIAALKGAFALALGWLAGAAAHGLLRRWRQLLADSATTQRWWRGLPLAGHLVLGLIGPVLFLVATLATADGLGLPSRAQAFLESLAAALAAGGIAQVCIHGFVGRHARIMPFSDASAAWLRRWLGWAVLLAVAGFVASETLAVLGYPSGVAEIALKAAGLAITGVLAALLFRVRQAGADRIRRYTPYSFQADAPAGPADGALESAAPDDRTADAAQATARPGPRPALREAIDHLRAMLARIWHLLALAYLAIGYAIWAFEIGGGLTFMVQGTALTVAALGLTHLIVMAVLALLRRKLRISPALARRIPSLPNRLAFYRPGLELLLILGLYACAAAAILQGWGLALPGWLDLGAFSLVAEVAFVLVLFTLIWEVVRGGIEWYLASLASQGAPGGRASRARTLLPFMRNAAFIMLLTLGLMTVLLTLGVNVAPLLAGAGVVGLAIGFGAQSLVRDIITGLFIMIENQIEIGDWVQLGTLDGEVEGLTIRTIRLRDLHGTVHVFPFSQVNQVSNFTRDYAFAFIEVGFAYQEDVDEIIAVMRAVDAEMRQDPELAPFLLGDLEIFGLERFEASAVVIRVRLKVVAAKQWWLRREFMARLKKHCAAAGIELPLPHTKLYFGESKTGPTPPARVAMADSSSATGQPSTPAPDRDPTAPEGWSQSPGKD